MSLSLFRPGTGEGLIPWGMLLSSLTPGLRRDNLFLIIFSYDCLIYACTVLLPSVLLGSYPASLIILLLAWCDSWFFLPIFIFPSSIFYLPLLVLSFIHTFFSLSFSPLFSLFFPWLSWHHSHLLPRHPLFHSMMGQPKEVQIMFPANFNRRYWTNIKKVI